MNVARGIINMHVNLFLLLTAFTVQDSFAEQEILIENSCETLYERGVTDPGAPGWSIDSAKHHCSICNGENVQRSWLLTKLLPVKSYPSIHVDVDIEIASCVGCKNQYVNVYITNKKLPGNNVQAVNELNNLPLLRTFPPKPGKKASTTYSFQFTPTTSGFALAFLSKGVCAIIRKIRISSFYCKKTILNGVQLPRTVSLFNETRRVNISCPKDSLDSSDKFIGLCSSNGTWEVQSNCTCKKGYTVKTTAEGCQKCPVNTYKDDIGNKLCSSCPSASNSVEGQLTCKCIGGHYRYVGDNYTKPCYGIPSKVMNVKVLDRTESSLKLLWDPPEKARSSGDLHYDVSCFKCPARRGKDPCKEPCGVKTSFLPSQHHLTGRNVTVKGLDPDTEYDFVICAKNEHSARINSSFCDSVVKATKTGGISSPDRLSLAVIVGVAVMVIVMLIVIAILVICLVKRRRTMQYRRSLRLQRGNQGMPLIPGEKNYIDPTTYDDPERAVTEFAKELDRNMIKFESIIGGGEFGDVYEGELKRPGETPARVAIKTLKAGASRKNRTDFLIEASVMGQFKNLNVISLEGVVTKSAPMLIVTEYMENGSLDKYLKNNDGMLKPLQLLEMARGVACGMEYLAGMHFVHRDLAARNVLVNANLSCKVADFGLSRDIAGCEDSEYETQGGKIPVRWTAPEAITYRKFSTASDVWSYGILLWEIMSFAERPYWSWGNEEVIARVNQGYRLPSPMSCPKIVHQLMKECWNTDRTKRPSFKELVRIIDEWITYPEKLNDDYIKVRRAEPLDCSTFTTVQDWLEAFKMGMYATNFSKAGYQELSDVAQLTESELLEKVGVRLVGHRHKIYQRIKEMGEQMKLSRDPSMRI